MTNERDNFKIMDAVTTSFGKQKRLSISKNLAIILAVLFVACLIGTGLVVYHLSSCSSSKSLIEKVECNIHAPSEDLVTTSGVVQEFVGTTTTILQTTTPPILSTDSTDLVNKSSVNVRLPSSLHPHSYDLQLIPFVVEGNFTFHGEVTIWINVTESTNNITLHADDLMIDESSILIYETVLDESGNFVNQTTTIRSIANDTEKQFFIIHLTGELEAGKRYYIYIKFIGILNDLLQGFYRSSYTVDNQTR